MIAERPHGWYVSLDGRTVFGPVPDRVRAPNKTRKAPRALAEIKPKAVGAGKSRKLPAHCWAPIDPWRGR